MHRDVEDPSGRRGVGRGLTAVVGILALSAAVAGCGGGDGGAGAPVGNGGSISASIEGTVVGPARSGGELRFGLAAETNGWTPSQGQWSATSYLVANAVFDPLAAFDDRGVAQPYLAQSLTHDDEFRRWTITVRPGVQFHDGSTLDAAAVAANLEADRRSGLIAVSFKPVTAVEVVDERTVTVTMDRPFATFPLVLAGQPGYVAAPSQLEAADGARRPVGTGPFKLVDLVPDQHLRVERNPSYWRSGLPYLDGIDFRVLPDGQSRAAALSSGQLDAMEVTTAEGIVEGEAAARAGELQFFSDAGRETDELIITLNTARAPFDDPRARQAFAAAIDREALSAIGDGAFPPAWGPLAEGSPAYLPPEEAGNTPHDPELARRLAGEYQAATGQPLTFTVLLPPDPALATAAQLIQAQLREAGIEARIESIEQTTMVNKVLGGDYQASGFALFSTPSLERAYPFIATEVPETGLSLNVSRLEDPELTAAMDRARATDDPTAQAEAYREVQRRLAAGNQFVFLTHRLRAIAYVDDVHGLTDTTFPDTSTEAFAGFFTSPFLTATWMEER